MSKEKYYFPELKKAIAKNGWTQEEFKQKARNINSRPSGKSWSLLMKANNGMTEAYANTAKDTLKELGFSKDICDVVKCPEEVILKSVKGKKS